MKSDTHASGLAAVDYYFIQDDGGMFKATIAYEPYFFVTCRVGLGVVKALIVGWDGDDRRGVVGEAV